MYFCPFQFISIFLLSFYFLFLSLPPSLSLPLSRTLSLFFSLSPSLYLPFSLSLSLSIYFAIIIFYIIFFKGNKKTKKYLHKCFSYLVAGNPGKWIVALQKMQLKDFGIRSSDKSDFLLTDKESVDGDILDSCDFSL